MGITKTLARLSKIFTWSTIRNDVCRFFGQCLNYQHTKYETRKPIGLLEPLPVPTKPCKDLSLDFIVRLPPYRGHMKILVVVDRFSKEIHLGILPTQYFAYHVANLFLDIIVKHHGMPKSLVSGRDPLFISKLWQELFKLSSMKLRISSAYHPQSDGQIEVMNRIIEQYLWVFVHNKPLTWGKFLPWVEWSCNTSWNTSTRTSPFEVIFGKKPPTILQYIMISSIVEAIDALLSIGRPCLIA